MSAVTLPTHQHLSDLRGAALLNLPDWSGVRRVNLDGLGLDALPEREAAPDLTAFSVYDNALTGVPGWVWTRPELRTLNLSANRFTALPDALGDLRELRMLDLGHNELVGLPDVFGGLGRLAFLYLSHNRLTELPVDEGTFNACPVR
ncbi:leucine-rich repeat domain-containing protein [Deinococcus sp. ME38]|uniref:leucine-rich repeat domain-containing protein n=1 Tax=Deinococcus sp. ME38 TaxID=3400344 RepID=UPI003B5AAB89